MPLRDVAGMKQGRKVMPPISLSLKEPPNPVTSTLVPTETAPFFTLMGHSREGAIHHPWW